MGEGGAGAGTGGGCGGEGEGVAGEDGGGECGGGEGHGGGGGAPGRGGAEGTALAMAAGHWWQRKSHVVAATFRFVCRLRGTWWQPRLDLYTAFAVC